MEETYDELGHRPGAATIGRYCLWATRATDRRRLCLYRGDDIVALCRAYLTAVLSGYHETLGYEREPNDDPTHGPERLRQIMPVPDDERSCNSTPEPGRVLRPLP